MSFNLNRLVQPECGAQNPLVAAAQQITMRPSTSTAGPMTRFRNPRQAPNTFAREFLDQQQQQQQQTSNQAIASNSQSSSFLHPASSFSPMLQQQQHHHHHQQQQQFAQDLAQMAYRPAQSMGFVGINNAMAQQDLMATTQGHQFHHGQSAAEQLETKYRNDIISQSSQQHQQKDKLGKLDDVEFWQGLSQQYIGPTTYDNIAKMTTHARAKNSTFEATTTSATHATEEHQDIDDDLEEVDISKLDEETLKAFNFDYDDMGENPSRIRIPRAPSELEYVFDERNPLKDQFENPFAEGLIKLEQGDIPSAALLFEAAVQLEPNNTEAWRYLGTTQAQNEKDMSAIRALRKCLDLDQTDQQARLAISVSLANEMYHHEACKYLLEWLISHERYKAVGANLEEFNQLDHELSDSPFHVNAVDKKHYHYVRDKFVEAARMSPTNPDPEVQSSLGVLFNMRGEYEKAVDCFKAALSVKSDDSLLWNRLGATLANGNKSDEAVIAYRKALEISPGFLRSRYNLAISLIHLNAYDEAAKQLIQILNMQAAGKGDKNTQIRTRSITSTAIWNTLRTVATLLNKPEYYPIIDGRDLARCNEEIFKLTTNTSNETSSTSTI